MTPQKAIQQIKILFNVNVYGLTDEAVRMAIDALEKQIPKKPMYIDGDYDFPLCPKCRLLVGENEEENYCSVCGQALDWEGIE